MLALHPASGEMQGGSWRSRQAGGERGSGGLSDEVPKQTAPETSRCQKMRRLHIESIRNLHSVNTQGTTQSINEQQLVGRGAKYFILN